MNEKRLKCIKIWKLCTELKKIIQIKKLKKE